MADLDSWCWCMYVCMQDAGGPREEGDQEGDWAARRLDQRPGDEGDPEDTGGPLLARRGQWQRQPGLENLRPSMEVAISAVAGEIVSRFISFLLNKYHSSHPRSEEKAVERLQHFLMRVCTIVEEADTRYITNFWMMVQLKTLSEAMYQGYSVLDNLRYRVLQDDAGFDKVPLGLVQGRVTHVVWPPRKIGRVDQRVPEGRVMAQRNL
ncbi:unnamed protein product [Triticum turgidum subsp. durum]|uniref:Rx N-terminal domain-containing protein n=1 Tax=Triticum turgidum subsp. durum TaxID=4567 RepID=A0A9R0XDI1_TRITD|nr:unnamed protein product [Triticum turgidum subsp. durum]